LSGKAFLTGVLVASSLATGALVATASDEVIGGRPLAGPVAPLSPLGDSLSTGRGPDLAGIRAGANPPAQPSTPPQVVPRQPPPPVVAGQQPGTVRLPHGGTATLIRQEVGADGTLPVPDGVGEATWWGADLQADAGATVLAGHVNWKGVTGPFAELWKAENGREVTVVDRAGTQFRFRVAQVITLHKDELPTRAVELFGPRGAHRLVLVTCGGEWVGGQVGYDENRVVIAEPVA
jgi:hypothetical protein